MFDKNYNELNSVDKTPLKKLPLQGKIIITDNLVVIKQLTDTKVVAYFFTAFIVAIWIYLFNNFFHLNFFVFDEEESIFITIAVLAFVILVTIINRAIIKSLKKQNFINKETGETSFTKKKKKKYHFNDVIGLQLLSYLAKGRHYSRSSGSSNYTYIAFEINLITKKKKRVPFYKIENDKEKSLDIANKLSSFFDKPLIVDIKVNDEVEKQTRTYRTQKNGIFVTADVVTSLKSLNKLLGRKEYVITQISDNSYTLNTLDPFFGFLNLPKKLKQINVSFTVDQKTAISATVKIKTNFRFDLLICLIYMVYFFFVIKGTDDTSAFILSTLFVFSFIRILNIRLKENEFVSEILEILLPEDEEAQKIEFNKY